MTQARSTIIKDHVEGVYHCISRCVRRAFLCGKDPFTNKDYEHRKRWLYLRLKELADIFFIDVCGYAIMNNHLHLILRNRPDLSASSTNLDIAKRWWRLFPGRRKANQPEGPTDHDLAGLLACEKTLGECRNRLVSISWFMRCLKENIARRANAEDECTGRFWEGRFKSIALLDQAAILTCAAYVDLNPIRAGIATTPETSDFTSAKERVDALQARKQFESNRVKESEKQTRTPIEMVAGMNRDKWLCPLTDEKNRRGFLQIGLDDYLGLIDWTGRQIAKGKHGAIPIHLAPILERLELNQSKWIYGSSNFGSLFYRVAGKVSNIPVMAKKAGQKWLKVKRTGKALFLAA